MVARGVTGEKKSPRCSHFNTSGTGTGPVFLLPRGAANILYSKYKATLSILPISQRARHSISRIVSLLTRFGGVGQGETNVV